MSKTLNNPLSPLAWSLERISALEPMIVSILTGLGLAGAVMGSALLIQSATAATLESGGVRWAEREGPNVKVLILNVADASVVLPI